MHTTFKFKNEIYADVFHGDKEICVYYYSDLMQTHLMDLKFKNDDELVNRLKTISGWTINTSKSEYQIVGRYNGDSEIIDETDNLTEAQYLLSEYKKAFDNHWNLSIIKSVN